MTIVFTLAAPEHVSLRIYDVTGREVTTLADADLPAGVHSVQWNRRTNAGGIAPAGVYFYALRAGAARAGRKLLLLP